MRILFFSYAWPNPIQPGLGTFNRTMIAGLAREHEVRVVSPVPFADVWRARAKGKLPQGLNDSAFQAVAGVKAEYRTWYYTPKLFRDCYGQFMRQSVGKALDRTIQEFRPDVVLSYWTHPDGEVAVEAAHRFGVPAVAMVGGSDVLINGRRGSRRKVTLDVLHAADGIVTVSDDIRQVLIADGIPIDKLHLVRRGIDQNVFSPGDKGLAREKLRLSNDRPIAISVGRLVDVKGHTHLIDACDRLNRRNVDFQCHLLGDGPLRSKLLQQIEERGLSRIVQLHGSQSPAQLADWYRAADLSVLASLSEGVPNVLMESIACGTRFVASNVGGIPEIADPHLDRLVPAADPAALADAIEFQLAMLRTGAATPRQFEPLTAEESARCLSCVLESVRVPQPRVETAKPRTNSLRQLVKTILTACVPRKRLLVRGPQSPGGRPRLALTFDDGPHPDFTPQLLDKLQQLKLKATFFVVGRNAERYPELVQRMVESGHEVANHTFTHSEPDQTTANAFLEEVRRTDVLLQQLTGRNPSSVRPPKGELTWNKLRGLWRERKTVALWNVDPKDFRMQNIDEMNQWCDGYRPVDGDIVLMHDTHPYALRAIEMMAANGVFNRFETTTIAQWMERSVS